MQLFACAKSCVPILPLLVHFNYLPPSKLAWLTPSRLAETGGRDSKAMLVHRYQVLISRKSTNLLPVTFPCRVPLPKAEPSSDLA